MHACVPTYRLTCVIHAQIHGYTDHELDEFYFYLHGLLKRLQYTVQQLYSWGTLVEHLTSFDQRRDAWMVGGIRYYGLVSPDSRESLHKKLAAGSGQQWLDLGLFVAIVV